MNVSDLIVGLFALGYQLAKLFGEDVDELRERAISEAEKKDFSSDASWQRWLDLSKK